MDQRTQFLIQVLEKIGSPLTMAVTALPTSEQVSDAQRVAELLNKSVQLGLTLADGMNVRDEAQADGVHLSLAAFAGPLIAGQYMASGRVPGDLEIRRMSGALQAVLTFADNFTPAADATLRLQNSEAGSETADDALVHVQMMNAFAPMLQAVAQYTFGRQETKLVQEIAGRIIDRAESIRQEMFQAGLSPRDEKKVDLVLVKMLAGIYAGAHMGEMGRLMAMPEHARNTAMAAPGGISMAPIWQGFDRQAAMVRTLAEHIVPVAAGSSASAGSSKPPSFVNNMANITPLPPTSPPPPSTKSETGNPMAFFAKKTAEDA